MSADSRIAFVGGGNMAGAIVGGLVASGFAAETVTVADPAPKQRAALRELAPGATIVADNAEAAAGADAVVLAVKPQIMPRVVAGLGAALPADGPLVISIAAGVRSGDIDRWLGGGRAVVRVMPNQAALLREGVSVMFANPRTSAAQRELAERVLEAVGIAVWVDDEALVDAATAVSGSGPAYFFLLMEMLIDAGREFGLDAAQAQLLAVETARGAASLAVAHGEGELAALRERVTSPGGTTAAALESLEADGVRAIFARALEAARARAVALADEAGRD